MVSKVLAQLCQRQGYEVKQSEVHGMAKRGGIVFSHVRFGRKVWSPTIPKGEADILVALEWAEGQRWLPWLRREGGRLIVDRREIRPPFACRDHARGAVSAYNPEGIAELTHQFSNSVVVDATGIAAELGNDKVANTVLLGALSSYLSFPREEWLAVLRASVPPKTVELNLRAFERGQKWSASATLPAESRPKPEPMRVPGPLNPVTVEINEAWCKGCDICVKMCPERCLIMNGHHVATITDPALCTGCRVCEVLCPDFAIRVRLQPATESAL
jgi:indolepyruvate ferredoxin oxidoreductase beta subunit